MMEIEGNQLAEFSSGDRLKAYQALAETSRKWANVMDAKAGFLSALNLGCLAFAWSGAKLHEGGGSFVMACLLLGTVLAGASLVTALNAVLPRVKLSDALGKGVTYVGGFKPISFYGFVAENYPTHSIHAFVTDVRALSEDDLASEALEQHYTISHVSLRKSRHVQLAGILCGAGIVVFAVGAIFKGSSNWIQSQETTASQKVTNASKTSSEAVAPLKSATASQPPTR